MKQIILHIPHASTAIPDFTGFVRSKNELNAELLKLTDWYTDELFANPSDQAIIAPCSRIFCDMERFANDNQEVMAQYGMGVLYEKTDSGEILRQVDPSLRKSILNRYYHPHHQRLNELTAQQLKTQGQALIIDCHSFPDAPLQRELDKDPNRPDFSLGTDPYHTPPALTRAAETFFLSRGYSLGINRPFAGTMVPANYYHKNRQVHALMLEVNRKLYLKNGTNQKSENFEKIKNLIQEFLDSLRKKTRSN